MVPKTRQRGRPGGPRLLSTDVIVDAAVDLLDQRGPAGLSMRQVADALGVRANALYTYVADRAALEGSIVERLLREADVALLQGTTRSWRRRVLDYACGLRDVLRRHPGALPLFMTAPMTGPVAVDVGEHLTSAFIDAGASGRDATRAAYTLISYVLGFLALDVAETDGTAPVPDDAERIRERRAVLAAVNPETHPHTATNIDTMAAWISGQQFEWGLNVLLEGIATKASASR